MKQEPQNHIVLFVVYLRTRLHFVDGMLFHVDQKTGSFALKHLMWAQFYGEAYQHAANDA